MTPGGGQRGLVIANHERGEREGFLGTMRIWVLGLFTATGCMELGKGVLTRYESAPVP